MFPLTCHHANEGNILYNGDHKLPNSSDFVANELIFISNSFIVISNANNPS